VAAIPHGATPLRNKRNPAEAMNHRHLARARCALLVAFLLAAIPAAAQTNGPPVPYGITDAYELTTIALNLELSPQTTTTPKRELYWTVTIWGRTSGGIEYSLDASSVMFTGAPPIETTADIIDRLSTATVQAGVDLGYASCTSSASSTGVTMASCVTRSTTGLVAASSSLNRRAYSYTCTSIVPTGASGVSACGEDAEGTWADDVLALRNSPD